MEQTIPLMLGTGYKHNWYGGAGDASYENLQIIDANGKALPWPTQGWQDGGAMMPPPQVRESIRKGIFKGEWALPFYGDFPAMPDIERRVTWDLMLGQESTTKVIIPAPMKEPDLIPTGTCCKAMPSSKEKRISQWRDGQGGGPVVDWDLKTTLDGLYAGRGATVLAWMITASRRATGKILRDERLPIIETRWMKICKISKDQFAREKARVYAPISARTAWMEGTECRIARAMQYYCSEFQNGVAFEYGLDALKEIEEVFVPRLYALGSAQADAQH